MTEYLATVFPGLRTSSFRVTSPADREYNCIAWAAADAANWWWPLGDSLRVVWPPSALQELTLAAFIGAFHTLGYVSGADESLQPGLEKVALFADAQGTPTHAARQLPSGRWTSKLGQSEDIEHELHALEGGMYGVVASILKRMAQGSS